MRILIILILLPLLASSQGIIRAGIIEQDTATNQPPPPPPPPPPGASYEWTTLKAGPSQMGYDATAAGFNWKTGTIAIGYWDDPGTGSTGSYNATNNYYRGTLKYLLNQTPKMRIIPRISGNVNMGSLLNYQLGSSAAKDWKYISGANAPFPGVRMYGGTFTPIFHDNWVIRGITIQFGNGGSPGQLDAFTYRDGDYLWVADCTFMHSPDENFSTDNARFTIFQNNLGLEGYDSHNKGSIFSADGSLEGYASMAAYDNGYIHCDNRFPNIEFDIDDKFEVINNCTYNGEGRICSGRYGWTGNIMNNYYKQGPNRSISTFKWNPSIYSNHSALQTTGGTQGFAGRYDDLDMYVAGNFITGKLTNPLADNKVYCDIHSGGNGYVSNELWPSHFFKTPYTPHPHGTDALFRTAVDGWNYNIVNKNIGSRYYTDSNGQRQKYIFPYVDNYFTDAINGTQTYFLNSTGGAFTAFSVPASGTPFVDVDFDGIPDTREAELGGTVGVQDHEGVPASVTLEGVEWTNTAGYNRGQIWDDYVHGGLLRLRDRIIYNNP